MKFKVGDKAYNKNYPGLGVFTCTEIIGDFAFGVWENAGMGSLFADDPEMIPEKIYNSPLYKALEEKCSFITLNAE